MKNKTIRVSIRIIVVLALAVIVHSPLGTGQAVASSGGQLVFGTPGVSLQSSPFAEIFTLYAAVPIINIGTVPVQNVTITSVSIAGGNLTSISPAGNLTSGSLPFNLGSIPAADSTFFDANFAGNFVAGGSHALTVSGTYQTLSAKDKIMTNKFSLSGNLAVAPLSPGSGTALTGNRIAANNVKGGKYPHRPSPDRDLAVNTAAPPVPTVSAPAAPTVASSSMAQVPNTPATVGDPVVFEVDNGLGFKSGTFNGLAANGSSGKGFDYGAVEPSGAVTAGGVVFVTANWTAAYSTDGVHFTQLDPTTIFPNDAVGYCCDQIVQYVPSIDRFIWLLQGQNGYRLASASPATIISSKGTDWTYWLLEPQGFGQPKGTGFDYPSLSVGTNNLYITWDSGIPCPAGCVQGYELARISLAEIQAGGYISWGYTHTSDCPSSITWGLHPTQDTGGTVYWAGHDGNNNLRVFSWPEGSSTYNWSDVGINGWDTNAPTSTTPDGKDWLAYNFHTGVFPRNGIIGATRSGGTLWFAWTAGTDSKNFPQAHIEMVEIDTSLNFIQQVQIWNPHYAFAYPDLATNACTGEVGLSLEGGGNGNYEDHLVGFWGDFVAYLTTNSNFGTDRYGDYATIRQAPSTTANPGNLFAAFGYGFDKPNEADVHYVLFGRPATQCKGK